MSSMSRHLRRRSGNTRSLADAAGSQQATIAQATSAGRGQEGQEPDGRDRGLPEDPVSVASPDLCCPCPLAAEHRLVHQAARLEPENPLAAGFAPLMGQLLHDVTSPSDDKDEVLNDPDHAVAAARGTRPHASAPVTLRVSPR
jgi:hypothetical protein